MRRQEPRCAARPKPGAAYAGCDAPFELYQDSSGGDNWRSTNHQNREGTVTLRFRGYRVREGTAERSGDRATPIVTQSRGA